MKKLINKVLRFRRTVSFIYSEKMIQEEWIFFGTFKIVTQKTA
ncbi:hypothetical protein [Chryseobacterium sp.]|nr:hypothetical protein [Chryseobacterium sp.]